jgi:hypothetical protein
MKSILLAAAALLASPVLAQTAPQTMPPADPAAQTAPADPAMAPPPPAAPQAPMAAPGGANIVFGQPTVTPPTPAPAEYPTCSRTVKDGCKNRGGK